MPFVYVPYELLNQWFDVVNDHWLSKMFAGPVFTSDEQQAVFAFDGAVKSVPIPDGYPPVESVWASDYWQQLGVSADRTLAVFMERGRLPEDLEMSLT